MAGLNKKLVVIDQNPGFIGPRVLFQILKEAQIVSDEKTASKLDIDKAMKLGTRYPFGPFEWEEKITDQNINLILKHLFEMEKNTRYKYP